MKLSKKLIILIIALGVSLYALTLFSLAANENNEEYKLGVMLKPDGSNEKVIHVMLGMTDEDSVASFQLGLNINIDEQVNIKFEFDSNLTEEEHKEARISEISDSEGKKIKRLNIYYVGTKELNPAESNEVEIGTITFEGANQPNTTIQVDPVSEFSTIASISHSDTPIAVDTFNTVINKQNVNQGENGNSSNSGDGSQNNEWSDPKGDNVSNSSGNNNNGGNLIEKFINSIKTGANKSVTWAILTLIVLVVIAIIIIKLKKKQGKH